MEKETGCKIVIRGEGSTKEGKLKNKQDENDNDVNNILYNANKSFRLWIGPLYMNIY